MFSLNYEKAKFTSLKSSLVKQKLFCIMTDVAQTRKIRISIEENDNNVLLNLEPILDYNFLETSLLSGCLNIPAFKQSRLYRLPAKPGQIP